MRFLRDGAVFAALVALMTTTGCVATTPVEDDERSRVPVLQSEGDEVLTAPGPDAAAAAVQTSRALFESSPAVVIAAGDDTADLAAAVAGAALGVPVLEGTGDAVLDELERLGAEDVVLAGEPEDAALDGYDVVPLEPTAAGIADLLGMPVDAAPLEASAVAALAGADPGAPVLFGSDAGAEPEGDAAIVVERPEASGVRVVAVDAPEQLAAVATARAAGAEVRLLAPDAPTVQRSPAAIEFLAGGDGPVLAIGAGFADAPNLDWQLEAAAGGLQLPGGGQTLFPAHTVVAMYGSPHVPVLGVLGEQGLEASIERARELAEPYRSLTTDTVLPAFELIATVASGSAGADGDYSNELDPELMYEWAKAAGDAGLYVVVDLQPGRTDFVTQAKRYEKVLALPWVGLALDPEWRLAPDQRHLVTIGSVGAAEVNAVIDYLTGLVHANGLPPKLLVLHQFRTSMITDRQAIDTGRDEVSVLIHADGQGGQGDKQATWASLRRDAPPVAWGWKNFYDEDLPMLTPEQTMQQVVPQPDLISYQ
ncbi:hypothetical protein [Desertivibrio insolitus]|uniref:hypothetical protein n=1 Tax=Herbiconiux sp. SYSU D00978 TaxID=2812562 RepID=UPI001A956929|nr:hypothetical protein [Herbiconiux sp. SYSU D00978]